MELFKFLPGTDQTALLEGRMINNALTIMWTERYRVPGEFEIKAHLSSGLREFLPLGALISHADTLEVMIVENHEISQDPQGDPSVKITGRSFETVLENRIVGMHTARGNTTLTEYAVLAAPIWGQVTGIINEHIGDISYTDDNISNWKAYSNIPMTPPGEQVNRTFKRLPVHGVIMELLAISDLGIKTLRRNTFGAPDSSSTESRFIIHRGADRTATVIFSWKSGDLDTTEYLWSNKPVMTSAVVVGRYVNTVYDIPGLTKYDRRIMVIDASDIDGNLGSVPVGAALTDVVNKMQVRGKAAVDASNLVTITRADLSGVSRFQYRKDFEVGDLVMLDGNFGIIQPMRITEYVEIQDENGETGHPTLALPGV